MGLEKRSLLCTLLVAAAVLGFASRANAGLIFTFTDGPGPGQSTLTLSGTAVATATTPAIADILPFDFISGGAIAQDFPGVTLTATSSGVHTGLIVMLQDNGVTGDVLFLGLGFDLMIGETVTGSGSATVNYDFANFISGGVAPSPEGAPFEIVIPEPAAWQLVACALVALVGRRRN